MTVGHLIIVLIVVCAFFSIAITTISIFIEKRRVKKNDQNFVSVDTSKMKLVSIELFETPNGIGTRNIYSEGNRVVTVTATPPVE